MSQDQPIPRGMLHYGGQWRPAHGSEEIAVRSPATRVPLGHVPVADADDVAAAVDAADRAFADWRRTDALDRGRHLRALADWCARASGRWPSWNRR